MADSDINIEITEATPISIEIVEDTPIQIELTATGPQGDNTTAEQVSYDNTYANSVTDNFFVGVVEQQGFDDRIIDAFLGIQSAIVFLQNNKVTSVIAGTNVTITGTATNPIINATGGGGGGGVAIGDAVSGGTDDRMLHVDSSGNVADDRFEIVEGTLFGLLDYQAISPLSLGAGTLALGGLDSTSLGGAPTMSFFGQSGDAYSVSIVDLDTLNQYLAFVKSASNEMGFAFWGSGQSVDGTADFQLSSNGIMLKAGTTISEFSTDGTLGGNSDSVVPTEKAVKTYVGTGFVPYTGASADVNLGTNDILAQNALLGGGTGAGVTLEVAGTTDMYYLSMQGTVTIDNNRDATLNSVNIDGIAGISSAGALTASTGNFTGDVLIDKAQPLLKINRTSNATAGLVEYATGGTTEWYFGEYSAGVSDFELHKSGGGSSGFIIRYSDQYALIRYGLNLNYLGTNNVPYIDGSRNLVASIVTPTELGYLSGVTSAIQTQLGNKQPLDSDLTTIAGLTATTDNFIVSVASAWASRTPSQVRTTLGLVIGTNVQAWDADLDTWATKTAPSGTVIGTTDTQTVTNKRIQPRVFTTTSTATLTPEIDTYDIFHVTAQAAAINVANHSTSTPADGEQIRIRFLDNGTARAITWGTNYVAKGGVALPSTTVLSKNLEVGFEWNANLTKWNLLASAQES